MKKILFLLTVLVGGRWFNVDDRYKDLFTLLRINVALGLRYVREYRYFEWISFHT